MEFMNNIRISVIIFIFLSFSCAKENLNDKKIVKKDYKKSSYELRKSKLWLDCSKVYKNIPLNLYNNNTVIADFNQDGYDDLLLTFTDYTETRFPLKMYFNDGTDSNFILQDEIIKNNIGVMAARKGIVGDYNGDSKPDVIFAESGLDYPPFLGTEQSILISTSLGYEYKFLSKIKWFGHGVCSADFDNDGDLDVYFTTPSEKLTLLVNTGTGTFINHPEKLMFPSYGVAISEMHDINKDKYVDLIIGGHNFKSDPNNHPARILLGNGVDFDNTRSINLPSVPGWDVIVDFNFADLDDDGVEEIIVNRTGDPGRQYYLGYRLQILKTNNYTSYFDITDKIIQNYSSETIDWFPWIRTEDIDNNGKLDIFNTDAGNNRTRTIIRWEKSYDGVFRMK